MSQLYSSGTIKLPGGPFKRTYQFVLDIPLLSGVRDMYLFVVVNRIKNV